MTTLISMAARSLDLGSRYDLIISATAGFAKGIRYDRARTKHLCYCYTPLRYAWESQYVESQIRNYKLGGLTKLLLQPVLAHLRRLRNLARSAGIEFLGDVADGQLCALYQNARTFVFTGVEDFGLVMAEAQACGTPVIALNVGGAREIVEDGVTGIFLINQTPAH